MVAICSCKVLYDCIVPILRAIALLPVESLLVPLVSYAVYRNYMSKISSFFLKKQNWLLHIWFSLQTVSQMWGWWNPLVLRSSGNCMISCHDLMFSGSLVKMCREWSKDKAQSLYFTENEVAFTWAFLLSWKMEVAGFCSVQRSKAVLPVLPGFLLHNILMVGYT